MLFVQLYHGCQRRYLHGANIHAGQCFGTGLSEMLRIDRPDSPAFRAVPGRQQIAIVGEGCAKEGMTVHIIRAYLQAEPAFEAFGGSVLMVIS